MSIAEAFIMQARDPSCRQDIKWAADMLSQSWKAEQHKVLQHPNLGDVIACEASQKAQRFVFSDDVTDAVLELLITPQNYEVALSRSKLPFNHVAYEVRWLHDILYLLSREEEGFKGRAWVHIKGILFPLLQMSYNPENNHDVKLKLSEQGTRLCQHYSESAGGYATEDPARLLGSYLPVLLTSFLNIKGCAEVDPRNPSRQQKRQAKREKKSCVLSFNRVTLKREKNTHVAKKVEVGQRVGVRRHAVSGHFRELRSGREEPVHVWVNGHWRGDAKLGVVLKETEVNA